MNGFMHVQQFTLFNKWSFIWKKKNDFIQQTILIQNIHCHFYHRLHSSILTLHLSFNEFDFHILLLLYSFIVLQR